MNYLKYLWRLITGTEKKERKAKHDEYAEDFKRREKKAEFYGLNLIGFRTKGLDFKPDPNEYIYMSTGDPEYAEYDLFVETHQEQLRQAFARRGYRFVYPKGLGKELREDSEVLKYFYPDAASRGLNLDALKGLPNDFLLNYLVNPDSRSVVGVPAFVRFGYYDAPFASEHRLPYAIFHCVQFEFRLVDGVDQFVASIIFWHDHRKSRGPMFSIVKPENADEAFDAESKAIMKEIQERLDRLREKGISMKALYNLIEPNGTKESSLAITVDHRLFMTDYDNAEVKMTPLVKAVYFLFLRHPEGIRFKELADYRDELALIYDSVKSGRPLPEKIHPLREHDKSIIALTDPLDNSINEKCARIREAFLVHVHDYIASHYYVTGRRGEPKRVILSPDKVVWNAPVPTQVITPDASQTETEEIKQQEDSTL